MSADSKRPDQREDGVAVSTPAATPRSYGGTIPGTPGSFSRASAAEDLIGTTLGEKYEVVRLLGSGGAGAVYLATQLDLDRPVALKVLRDDLMCDLATVERFRLEARSAARLHHPNVVAVYDFGTMPEVCAFIAMEYLPGRTLREEIQRHPRGLPTDRVERIFSQICDGVNAAHEQGIIHRDLKPGNILLAQNTGGTVTAKVLDFGIAKVISAPSEGISDLTGGALIGTPHYSSPEQCLGESLDPRSDVYSLGVVLYQMLTGRLPFEGNTPSAIIVQHVTKPAPTPRAFRPDLPEALEGVILRSLAKNPADRPLTALDFANLVSAALRDQDSFVTTPGLPDGNIETLREALRKTESSVSRKITEDRPTLLLPPEEQVLRPGTTTVSTSGSGAPLHPGMSGSADLSGGKRRLAVLPLRNLARIPDIDFLEFSLADAIITQLAYVKALIVRPSSSIERYRSSGDLGLVAADLDVDTVLTGNFLKSGEKIRVSTQLVDVLRNEIIWREQIDLPFDDILVLQDQIAEKVVEGLKLTLSPTERELIHRDVPKDVFAYELYLRAKNCGDDIGEIHTAIGLLERSLEGDAGYAPAWAEMAHRRLLLTFQGIDSDENRTKAEDACRRALEINPDLPEAHYHLMAAFAENGRIADALRTCFDLLRVAPNNELAYLGLGHVYEWSGLLDRALMAYTRSMRINPKLTGPYNQIAAIHFQRGNYDEAMAFVTNNACSETQCEVRAYLIGLLDSLRGETGDAIRFFTLSEQLSPKSVWGRLSRMLRLRLEGDFDASLTLLDQIRDNTTSGDGFFYLAHHYTAIGKYDIALELLDKAINGGYCNVVAMEEDPVLEPLRGHDGFQGLVDRARKGNEVFRHFLNDLIRLQRQS